MTGLAQAAGIGPTIDLDGEKLFVTGKIIRHYALMEAEIIKLRHPTPLEMVRTIKDDYKDSPDLFERFARIAIQEAKTWGVVTRTEIFEWLQTTMSGFVLTIWLAVRDNNKDKWTFERTRDLICDKLEEPGGDEWKASVEEAIDQASGETELGN